MNKLLIAGLFISCISANAQSPSITLNDVELRLEMPKDEVLRKLRANGEAILHRVGAPASQSPPFEGWCIKWKSDQSDWACSFIGGIVGFDAVGRLFSARKDLFEVTNEESAASLVSEMFMELGPSTLVQTVQYTTPWDDSGRRREVRVRSVTFISKG